MTVVERLTRELERMPEDLAGSSMAGSALVLAEILDGHGSPTSKAIVAKEYRETVALLQSLAPPEEKKDGLDDLAARREARIAGGATPAHSARP